MSNNENKTNDSFSKGIILIVIGVIALLITFFDFEINWHVMVKMWPILLIIIGVCIMPINKWIRTVIALVLLVLGAVAYHQKAEGDEGWTKVHNRIEYKSHTHTYYDCDDDD